MAGAPSNTTGTVTLNMETGQGAAINEPGGMIEKIFCIPKKWKYTVQFLFELIKKFQMTNYRENMQYALQLKLDNKITKLLKGSGFENLFESFVKYGKVRLVTHYRPLMDALYQCFNKDDNTFNLGQTKIYFGLEDVFMITGLPIDGEPVKFGEVTKEECLELVGISPDDSNRFSNDSLVKIIEKINEKSSQLRVEQACRCY